MARTIYLAVFSNGGKPAHWAVFVPTGDTGTKGKLIHVEGTLATGFTLLFVRGYDFANEQDYQIIHLAQVKDEYITDEKLPTDGKTTTDTTCRDRLEMVALDVRVPGPSPNPFANDPNHSNCQTWLQAYIKALVDRGFIQQSAIEVLGSAPKQLEKSAHRSL